MPKSSARAKATRQGTDPGGRTAPVEAHDRPEGCTLDVRVIPRSGRPGIAGMRRGTVLVRVAAPPVEGAANAAVIDLLAQTLGIPRRSLTILRGAKGRDKLIGIHGLGPQVVSTRLEAHLRTE